MKNHNQVLEVVLWISMDESIPTPAIGFERRVIEFLYKTGAVIDFPDFPQQQLTSKLSCRCLIGSHCEFETGDDPHQAQTWVFQVVKHRSLTDKILGKNKQEATDACFLFFKAQFESTPYFKDVQTR